jgi:hypothetical protein
LFEFSGNLYHIGTLSRGKNCYIIHYQSFVYKMRVKPANFFNDLSKVIKKVLLLRKIHLLN